MRLGSTLAFKAQTGSARLSKTLALFSLGLIVQAAIIALATRGNALDSFPEVDISARLDASATAVKDATNALYLITDNPSSFDVTNHSFTITSSPGVEIGTPPPGCERPDPSATVISCSLILPPGQTLQVLQWVPREATAVEWVHFASPEAIDATFANNVSDASMVVVEQGAIPDLLRVQLGPTSVAVSAESAAVVRGTYRVALTQSFSTGLQTALDAIAAGSARWIGVTSAGQADIAAPDTLTLADHPAGAAADAFAELGSETDAVLFRFRVTPVTGVVDVTRITLAFVPIEVAEVTPSVTFPVDLTLVNHAPGAAPEGELGSRFTVFTGRDLDSLDISVTLLTEPAGVASFTGFAPDAFVETGESTVVVFTFGFVPASGVISVDTTLSAQAGRVIQRIELATDGRLALGLDVATQIEATQPPPTPVVMASATAPATAQTGTLYPWSFQVSSNQPVATLSATATLITSPPGTGAHLAATASTGSCTTDATVVACNFGAVQTATVSVTTVGAAPGGHLHQIEARGDQGATTAQASTQIVAPPTPIITVDASAAATAAAGTPYLWALQIASNLPVASLVTTATLTASPPGTGAHLAATPSTGSCTADVTVVACNFGAVQTATVSVTSVGSAPGTHLHQVQAQGDGGTGSAQASTQILGPVLTTTVTAPATAAAGSSYVVRLRVTGTAQAIDVTTVTFTAGVGRYLGATASAGSCLTSATVVLCSLGAGTLFDVTVTAQADEAGTQLHQATASAAGSTPAAAQASTAILVFDSDNDGVLDHEDRCPDAAGPGGCPPRFHVVVELGDLRTFTVDVTPSLSIGGYGALIDVTRGAGLFTAIGVTAVNSSIPPGAVLYRDVTTTAGLCQLVAGNEAPCLLPGDATEVVRVRLLADATTAVSVDSIEFTSAGEGVSDFVDVPVLFRDDLDSFRVSVQSLRRVPQGTIYSIPLRITSAGAFDTLDVSVTLSGDASIVSVAPPEPITDANVFQVRLTAVGAPVDITHIVFVLANETHLVDFEVSPNEAPPVRLEFTTFVGPTTALTTLGPLVFWTTHKNSDDVGTSLDFRADLLIEDVLVASGQTLCVTGLPRDARRARQVVVPFGVITGGTFTPGDVLKLRVAARIGTTPAGAKCPGHSSSAGARLYYDAARRASMFQADFGSGLANLFLHSDGGACQNGPSRTATTHHLDDTSPTATREKCRDSGALNFVLGNPWMEIGTWQMTLE